MSNVPPKYPQKAQNSSKTDLVVALDFPDSHSADQLISQLNEYPIIFKVGLELFLSAGPDWVRSLCSHKKRVLLDLKFHDIPNTVAAAVKQAEGMGVEFVTVHFAGGKRMLDRIEITEKTPKILGVSVLTSFAESEWKENCAIVTGTHSSVQAAVEIEKSVLSMAKMAMEHPRVFGMVCSPKEVALVKARFPNLFTLVPGIRSLGVSNDDQSRVMTPKEASQAGASAIVVGRPITQAAEPWQVVESILKELN